MTSLIKTYEPIYNTTIGTQREKQWSVEVHETDGGVYIVRAIHGVRGGKMVIHDSEVKEGKNIGRKNETSAREQALLEAERDWVKKVKSGYSPEKLPVKKKLIRVDKLTQKESKEDSSIESTEPVKNKMLKPMLALEMDIGNPGVTFPAYVQPKLDGVRCLIYLNKSGNLIFQSRQNTIYEPFEHLVPELENLIKGFKQEDRSDLILDGELYNHGMAFEKVTSIVRRSKTKHPEVKTIQYHIYDCFYSGDSNLEKNKIGYNVRYKALTEAFGKNEFKNLVLVQTEIVKSMDEVEKWHIYFTTLKTPYEGVMIRGMNSPYKQQGRSKDLLKYKKFHDDEFVVIGHHEGVGAHKGTPIFECNSKTKEGKTFSVTMSGTIEGRKKMLENVDSYYGKLLTVKYQEISADGAPRFPVGIAFRDYE
jgi:ATP-dependent DNA ligase